MTRARAAAVVTVCVCRLYGVLDVTEEQVSGPRSIEVEIAVERTGHPMFSNLTCKVVIVRDGDNIYDTSVRTCSFSSNPSGRTFE